MLKVAICSASSILLIDNAGLEWDEEVFEKITRRLEPPPLWDQKMVAENIQSNPERIHTRRERFTPPQKRNRARNDRRLTLIKKEGRGYAIRG